MTEAERLQQDNARFFGYAGAPNPNLPRATRSQTRAEVPTRGPVEVPKIPEVSLREARERAPFMTKHGKHAASPHAQEPPPKWVEGDEYTPPGTATAASDDGSFQTMSEGTDAANLTDSDVDMSGINAVNRVFYV